SMAVLALEELAKVPLIFEIILFGMDLSSWSDFWKLFFRHKFKQSTIARYGTLLAGSGQPYSVYLSDKVLDGLDQIEKSGLYVDREESGFSSPAERSASVVSVLDYILVAAEERADSIAQFHSTPEATSRIVAGAWAAAAKFKDQIQAEDVSA